MYLVVLTKIKSKIHYCTLTVIVLVFAVTFFVILPLIFWNHPFSVYYTLDKNDALQLINERNAIRAADARDYFDKNKDTMYNFHYQRLQSDLFLLVTVVTTSRQSNGKPLHYLLQTVVSSHKEIVRDERISAALTICNVESDPLSHKEAALLSQHVPSIVGNKRKTSTDRYEKEKEDYVFCLEQSQLFNPRYILMLEDDSVPRERMLSDLKHILDFKMTTSFKRGERTKRTKPWVALKLYYPESWMGFAFEWPRFLQLVGLSLMFGSLFVFVAWMSSKWFQVRYTSVMLYAILILGSVYGILLGTVIGRPTWLELRRFHPTFFQIFFAPGCCTPATLYPSWQLTPLVRYLNSTSCNKDFGLDIAIDKYAQENNQLIFQAEPNLFRHIGLHSTLSKDKERLEEFLI